ncbi:hypothetical protein FHS51_001418 [Sphingobium wenxiniae]|uniref:Uncharacterized protein DUF3168 n=1 Tax=Sphingobium wenxiniae (strain DSM 21828 / CGMCC 1.7748 / JZ-1) TaxID=595605 RepID=A0A562KL66_SPHWJ|nr:DUF3168 domain-containing protein [Sphingobium wenxiniae]MBB6191196.1 hypothetical protein [Sphingobium wenxiniae]TWH96005.1 uncharacterized protein DUF3168 [Sphingobium wenxiniae]
MGGCEAVRGLFAGDNALTALVPAERIVIGDVPAGFPVPCIALFSISAVDRNTLKHGAVKRVTERVQATVMAPDSAVRQLVQRTAKKAADGKMPTVEGILHVTVHSIGAGADGRDPETGIHMGTQDFRVSYNEI